jgi:hypothetical protein
VGVPDFHYDLAYMGVYLQLEVCNFSPYLVGEAEVRIDGFAPGTQKVVTSRTVTVGPLLPQILTRAEVGIGAPGGIGGTRFETVRVHPVGLTPPEEMVPAEQYPALLAQVLDVAFDPEAPDRRERIQGPDTDLPLDKRHTIRIGVRNEGPSVVKRARLELTFFQIVTESAAGQPARRCDLGNWILDMPRAGWDPYRLPRPGDAVIDPAPPLPPGQSHEFTLVLHGGGPRDWSGSRDALSVVVREVKLGAL